MRVAAVVASTLLVGSLAGCATQPATSPAAPTAQATTAPTQPAMQAAASGQSQSPGSYDGVYVPPNGRVMGNSRCGSQPVSSALRVSNGMARFQTISQGLLQAPVSPDGTINLVNGRATLNGKISGNQFNGTYSVGSCGYSLQYVKR